MAVRILLLLVGLALGVRGDVRARDPEEEDEPGTVPGHGGWERLIPGVFGTHRRSGPHGHRPATPGPAHQPQGHGPPLPGPEHLPVGHRPPHTDPEHHPLGYGPSLGAPEYPLLAHRTPAEGPLHHPLAHGPPPSGPAFVPPGLSEEPLPTGDGRTQQNPARTGNWCAFVHHRVVTTAVSCGTEKYTIKSQSPCPNGTPDCQLVMYKLSTRPVYRLEQKIVTALLWRCCPGHGGHNCEETVADGHTGDPGNRTAGSGLPGPSAAHHPAAERLSQPAGDQTWEQNDFQHPGGPAFDRQHPNTEPSAGAFTSTPHLDRSGSEHRRRYHQGADPDYGPDPDYDYDDDHNHDQDQDQDQDQGQEHGRGENREQDHGQSHHQSPRERGHSQHQDNDRARHHGQEHDQNPYRHHDPNHVGRVNHEQDQDHERVRIHHRVADRNQDHSQNQEYNPHRDHDHSQRGPGGEDFAPGVSAGPDATQLSSLPLLMQALMAQLWPVLDGFNRTLEHLSREVGGLSRDLARLKLEREGRGGASGESARGEMGDFEGKLDESLYQLEQVREELRHQRGELEDRIHAQQAMMHYNLTNFKTDTDVKIKRSQKMIQVHLLSLNTSLAEVKQNQEQLEQEVQRGGPHRSQHTEAPAVWAAIDRLDTQVVNNTVKVNALLEDLDLTTGNIRDLQRGFRGLEDRIGQTGRQSQILFMETGLEVEAAKVEVLNRVTELASNLTLQEDQLKEMESDLDYLYTQFYRVNSTGKDCDCKALGASLAQLEVEVANISKMVDENRQAVEEFSEGQDHWDMGGDTSVEDLKQGLLQVKETLAFEQDKSRVLHLNVSLLQASSRVSQQEIHSLQESDKRKATEMRRLASSFSSLLKDAVRHTEVLEVLLGEEVLEFKDRPLAEQEEYSIPVLRDRIQQTLVQIKHQNLSLNSLWKSVQEADLPAGDQAFGHSEPGSRGLRMRSEDTLEEGLPYSPMGDRPDYSVSDFWSLGKEVEDLEAKVSQLEEQRCISCCNCTKNTAPSGPVEELQGEVALLRRGLEDHLRVFKNIFSDMDGLADSDGTLELDKLWALIKKKEAKKQRRAQKEKMADQREGHGGRKLDLRSRRDASLATAVLTQATDVPLMFLAGTHGGASEAGTVIFEEVLLNYGQMYSEETGTFRAPTAGVYLFILTVDFGPGPALARLKRGEVTAATFRQNLRESAGPTSRLFLLELERGEQLRFELSEGTVQQSNVSDNTFAGLLLFRNT